MANRHLRIFHAPVVLGIDDDDFSRLTPLVKLRVLAHRRKTAYTPNADACRACGLCLLAGRGRWHAYY